MPTPEPTFDVAASDDGCDAAGADLAPVLVAVVAIVGIAPLGPIAWLADHAVDRLDDVDQQDQLGDVVAVTAGKSHARGMPVASMVRWWSESQTTVQDVNFVAAFSDSASPPIRNHRI